MALESLLLWWFQRTLPPFAVFHCSNLISHYFQSDFDKHTWCCGSCCSVIREVLIAATQHPELTTSVWSRYSGVFRQFEGRSGTTDYCRNDTLRFCAWWFISPSFKWLKSFYYVFYLYGALEIRLQWPLLLAVNNGFRIPNRYRVIRTRFCTL